MLWTLISFHLALSFSQELQGVLAVQGPLTLSSSVGWFAFYPALLFRGRGQSHGWLDCTPYLHRHSFLFPSLAKLHSSLCPSASELALNAEPPAMWPRESEPISQTTEPAKALPSARFLPLLPTCYVVVFLLGLNIHSLSCVCIFSFHSFSTCFRAMPSYGQIVDKHCKIKHNPTLVSLQLRDNKFSFFLNTNENNKNCPSIINKTQWRFTKSKYYLK